MKRAFLLLSAFVSALGAQALDPAALLKPPTGTWPSYNGDYSGRRYSSLTQINDRNVQGLTLAWSFQTHAQSMKGTPLEVNGILYLTVPDHIWAVDARTGRQIWHFQRPSEGNHISNRGVAMYKNRLYYGTTDAHILCLDARTGKQIWDKQIADPAFGYYLAVAPLVVKDKIIIGTSGDQADVRHWLIAFDPMSGDELWRWSSLPDPGTPAAATWPDEQRMKRGGGSLWLTGTYDPALNLLYWGTGNPDPVLAGVVRPGANLFTCSIVAINPDTGKLVWFYQPSPHDTHDWDAVETPVLFDADFHGKPRKMLAQASRNGYFFVLDRATGEHLLTSPLVPINWASGLNPKGEPISDPAKEPQPDGSLVQTYQDGTTNWNAPSFDPETKLFYVNVKQGYSLYYLTLGPDKKPEGHQGGNALPLACDAALIAVDYQTGKTRWTRNEGRSISYPGILTTAGHLLFTADVTGNLLALDPATGRELWHTYAGGLMNSSPMTYQLDGRQYVLTAVDSVLYAWALPERDSSGQQK
ncbi:MAG TPA: acido-empty-quinoprotein group A [Bryobacteraceae bacterium]|nr:acido-empty-quinoprotein group A [Bryobacteraceae bacterium]